MGEHNGASPAKVVAGKKLNVELYRERVAGAVSMAVSELVAANRDDQNQVMKRMVAAYFLHTQDHLLEKDIALIMNKKESWVRYSTDYIERRMSHYYAFDVYIKQTMATYALASS